MKARLVALAIASLAAVGLQPVQADELFVYQGVPKLEFSEISFQDDSTFQHLQPSKGVTRVYHEIDVSVVSNGDPETIDQVTFCLYNADDSDYNTIDGNADNTADEACGYTNGDSETGTVVDDPTKVAAFKWEKDGTWDGTEGSDVDAQWSAEGSNLNAIDGALSDITVGTTGAGEYTYVDRSEATQDLILNRTTFTFVFALSHATTNGDNWKVRVSAQTTSLGANDASGGTGDEEDLTQSAAIDSYDSVTNSYGVYFFAAFSGDAVRGQQDFGSVQENGSKTIDPINTATYWANDTIDISMIGTDFEATVDEVTDTIQLVTDSVQDTKAIMIECTGDDSAATSLTVPSLTNFSVTAEGINENILVAAQAASGETAVDADTHSCELSYGSGAQFGDFVYSNTMTLGLMDANITDDITAGLFGVGDDDGVSSAGTGPPINPES